MNIKTGITLLLFVATAAADFALPQGVAAGILYLGVLLIALWYKKAETALWLAAIAMILVLLDWKVSSAGSDVWKVTFNRIFSIASIWFVAFVFFGFMRSRQQWATTGKYHIFDYMMEGIQIIDRAWRYHYVNDSLTRQSPYTRQELLGHTMMEKYPGIEKTEMFQHIHKCMHDRIPKRMVNEFRLPNGMTEYFELSIQPVSEGVLLLSVNITKQKQRELELRKLSIAVEQSPVSIVTADTNGNIEYVNTSFTEVTGYHKEEVKGRNLRMLQSGKTPRSTYTEMWNSITSGRSWKGEFCNRKKDGSLFWEHATISPLIDDDGSIVNYVGIKEDITGRKLAEENILKATLEGQENERQRISSELHDGILPILSTIKRNLEPFIHHLRHLPDTRRKEYRYLITLLDKTLKDIRAVSRDLAPPSLKAFGLATTLRDLCERMQLPGKPKILFYSFGIDEISDHPIQNNLYRIAQELLYNAIKHARANTITLQLIRHQNNILLMAEDDGIGFDPSEKPKGLGINNIMARVKAMQGFMDIDSTKGKGTSITIEAPGIPASSATAYSKSIQGGRSVKK